MIVNKTTPLFSDNTIQFIFKKLQPGTPIKLANNNIFEWEGRYFANLTTGLVNIEDIIVPDSKPSVTDLVVALKTYGYTNFKQKSSTRLFVLKDGSRVHELESIAKFFHEWEAEYDSTPLSASSVGCVRIGKLQIFVKPLSKQGAKSAGIENEIIVIDQINKFCNEFGKIRVIFRDDRQNFICDDVTECIEMGRDTSGRKKADIIVKGKTMYPVSIKKDNAETWESADKYYSHKAKKILDDLIKKGKVHLEDHGTFYKVNPTVAVKATREEVKNVVFGSDLGKNGCVATRTFREQDFQFNFEEKVLIVRCSNIITKMSDVKGSKSVWFLIRNDKTRNTKGFYPGLRVLAAYEKRINKKVLRV